MRALPWTAVLLLAAAAAPAADWPQWLGPHRDGASTEVVKPWAGEPKVLWRVPVGEGHSSPVVAVGRVYLHAAGGPANTEAVRGFAADAGERLWSDEYGRAPFASPFGVGPRATPV